MGANPVEATIVYSSIVFTIGLFYYIHMNYKRLFLNWIKQRDPQNKFEHCLQNNNNTLKNHIKMSQCYNHLIIYWSFSWSDTAEGSEYWIQFYNNWIEFYLNWTGNHYKE